MDTRIYVATHKKFDFPSDKVYIPLHVGREGKEDLGYIGDNTGDNISEKNPYYCELTGVYWMWKNVKCDIIGLCHYRRYLNREGVILKKEQIEDAMGNYDVIMANSSMVGGGQRVVEHFTEMHNKKDLDICRQTIAELEPDYLDSFDYCMQSSLMHIGNIMIAKKEIFDEYCSWLFRILFKVEERTDVTQYDNYQKRLYGYLAERLGRVWLLKQNYRVKEEMLLIL